MDKKVKITASKLNEYTRRELGLRIWLLIIPTFLLAFASIKLEKYFELSVIMLLSLIIMALLFLFKREYAKTFFFTINNNSIEFKIDLSQVNLLLELFISFILARNKARHGSTENAIINFKDIKSIEIKTKEIIVISKKNSALTNNGKIRIPKEIENYNEFLAVFEKIKTPVKK